VQSGKSHCGPQTSAAIGIECDDLVLGDAVEMAIRPKAQTSRPAKFGQAAGREDAHKMSVRGVVFANGRRGVRRAERVLARYDDVAVGCDRQIKRAEFRVADQPDRPHALTGVKRNDSVVAQAFGVDPGGEKNLPSGPNANPRGNGTIAAGRKRSPAASSDGANAITVPVLRELTK
jgi:hypothetical protein